MENCGHLSTCGLEILNDPVLRTTAAKYDFKYVPGEQFQRIIRTVQRDRLMHKKDNVWSEFCNSQASKFEMSSARGSCNVIQTKSSSIRIISSPMLQYKADVSMIQTQEESSSIYTRKTPQIRIMTDEEITNVIENAFKEVLDQAGNSKMQQLLTCREDQKYFMASEVTDSCITNTLVSPINASDPDETTSETGGLVLSTRSSVSLNEEDDRPIAASVHIENTSQPTEERTDDPKHCSPKSDGSESSKSSSKSGKGETAAKKKNVTVRSESVDHSRSSKSESEIEESIENACETYAPISSRIEIVPQLTSIEKEELRKCLGIEYILDSDINLSHFDGESDKSSYDGGAQEEKIETDIHPLVHIQRPTSGRYIQEIGDHPNLGPIQSRPEIQQSASAAAQSTRINPRKQANEGPNKSPFKSFRKGSNITVTTPKSAAVTARSSRRTQIAKSPGRLSTVHLPDQKQEHEALMSKAIMCQQRIILALEQIRINLDEIPQSEDILELKRRQKRADEFSTRFTRNYLYEIGRLMEEVQIVPKDEYLSRKDNGVLSTVCTLFNNLSQAAQCYLKHMNGFITDANPKMLDNLLEVASKSTKICVHKTIFDKTDPIVQDLLRGIKGLEKYLMETQQHALQLQQQRIERLKRRKINKSETRFSERDKKLSMYDSMPVNKFGMKRKACGLKGATRLKPNFRSLIQTGSTNSKTGNIKSSGDVSSVELCRSGSLTSSKAPVSTPACLEGDFEQNHEICTLKVDHIETHIETVEMDDIPDNDSEKGSKCPVNTSRTNIINEQDIIEICEEKKESVVDNTIIEALESITKEQVKQMLAPLISSLGTIMPTQASCTNADITTMVNNLIASQLDGVCGGSKGPSFTLNQEKTGNKFKDAFQSSTSCPFDSGPQVYDNNANCKRELAMQNLHRIHKPQPLVRVVVPAPNAFSVGELNNTEDDGDDTTMTPSQQQRPHNIGDSEALVAGSRTRINTRNNDTEGDHTLGHCEGGGVGASETDIQTKKVLQNVKFNTASEREQHVNPERSKLPQNDEMNKVPMHFLNEPFLEENCRQNDINRINEERLRFLEQISENPLYVNEHFGQPWKIITKITNQIVDDAMNDVERSINFGEETFVRDFIKMELE